MRILVPEPEVERARELLEEFETEARIHSVDDGWEYEGQDCEGPDDAGASERPSQEGARVFRCAVIGVFLPPVLLVAIWVFVFGLLTGDRSVVSPTGIFGLALAVLVMVGHIAFLGLPGHL